MWDFKLDINKPSTYPLSPIKMNNTGPPRITATAGTRLVGTSFLSSIFFLPQVISFNIYVQLTYKVLLDQALTCCPIFPTAAPIRRRALLQSQCG